MPLPEGKNAEGQVVDPPLENGVKKAATPKKRAPRKKTAATPVKVEAGADDLEADADAEATPKKKRAPVKRKAKVEEGSEEDAAPKSKKARTPRKAPKVEDDEQ